MFPGEHTAWQLLASLAPDDVCRRGNVRWDEASGAFWVPSFGMDFAVNLREKSISGTAPESAALFHRLEYFYRPCMLFYLAQAKDIAFTGRLVRPGDLSGGRLFLQGSHVLPLQEVAERYGSDRNAFLEKGISLGGEPMRYGDAACRLLPFPRIPVHIILWLADDEFPARAGLLFDSSCEIHLAVDVLWSVAMLAVLAMT